MLRTAFQDRRIRPLCHPSGGTIANKHRALLDIGTGAAGLLMPVVTPAPVPRAARRIRMVRLSANVDNVTERDERIQRRGRALVELVSQRLPQEVEIASEAAFWSAVSLGLLSRMAGTVSSIMDLQLGGHRADATTLGRSLYEHAVHFAWLAAEPSAARLQEWRKYDLQQRLKAEVTSEGDESRDVADPGPPTTGPRRGSLTAVDSSVSPRTVPRARGST
jgi:hypothetical protein